MIEPVLGKSYKVKLRTEYEGQRGHNIPIYGWGECVYIHPKKRFCVLLIGGSFRESFTFDKLMVR